MKKLCIMIVCGFILLCGCQKQNAPNPEGTADAPDEPGTSAMDAYIGVLTSDTALHLYPHYANGYSDDAAQADNQGIPTLLNDLPSSHYDNTYTWTVSRYSIVDLDKDGTPEIVVELSLAGEQLIFHYTGSSVYAYPFSQRGMNTLKEDGTYCASNGAAYSYINTLKFEGHVCKRETVAYSDTEPNEQGELQNVYYSGNEPITANAFSALLDAHNAKTDVTWHTYTAETAPADFAAAWAAYTK